MGEKHTQRVLNFCQIQLALLKEREASLRKELLDCKIQKEFLTHTISELKPHTATDKDLL